MEQLDLWLSYNIKSIGEIRGENFTDKIKYSILSIYLPIYESFEGLAWLSHLKKWIFLRFCFFSFFCFLFISTPQHLFTCLPFVISWTIQQMKCMHALKQKDKPNQVQVANRDINIGHHALTGWRQCASIQQHPVSKHGVLLFNLETKQPK